MTQPDTAGYGGEESAFRSYTAGVNPLAEQLHGASKQLDGGFDAHTFSKIGAEVGLADAIAAANRRQRDGVRGLADGLGGTAEAVRGTWTNMAGTEEDHAASLRRAAGDPS